MPINTQQYPYFNDYDPAKNYHQILFVPGNPVQARELTQIQSILQEQIKRQGDHLFQNGTMVIPGHIFYDSQVQFIKLDSFYNNINANSVIGSIVGLTIKNAAGVEAHIVHAEQSTDTDPVTLYVKYTKAANTTHEFSSADILTNPDTSITLKIVSSTSFTGFASIATINEGVYYINGYFIGVSGQTVVVGKYDNIVTAVVGLELDSTAVTANDDDSLFDNASGFSNFGAPGADRLKLSLNLVTKLDLATSGINVIDFIELIQIKDGVIQKLYNDTKYAEIETMLARRTYDESGDYIVNPFTFAAREYRSNNRGQWVQATPYLAGDFITNAGISYFARNDGISSVTAPTHAYGTAVDGSVNWTQVSGATFNDGLNPATGLSLADHRTAEGKFILTTSSGKGYIKGFEVNIQDKRNIVVDKARETTQVDNAQIYAPVGSYVTITNVAGVPDISSIPTATITNSAAATIGTCYVRSIEYVSGTIGSATALYNLFIFGITMNNNVNFKSSAYAINISTTFTSNIVTSSIPLSGYFSGTAASPNVTGKGTLFTSELKVGDSISLSGTSNSNRIVLSIQSDVALTLASNITTSVIDVGATSSSADLIELGKYVKPFKHSYIKTLRDANGAIDTGYTLYKKFGPFTVSGTTQDITTSTSGESFLLTGHIVANSVPAIINASYSYVSSDPQQLRISGLTNGQSITVLAVMKRVGNAAKEKTKTLLTKTVTINDTDTRDESNNVVSTHKFSDTAIGLSEADVIRVIKVTKSGSTSTSSYSTSGETDITKDFTLKSNQTSAAYFESQIVKKPRVVINRPIRVTFEYFDHSPGDYFSVDSYSSIPYTKIPSVALGETIYSLRDCLDFRARRSDNGTSWTSTGGSVTNPLQSTSVIETSYSYYLPRNDILILNKSGEFSYIEGISSDRVIIPAIPAGSLQLANISLTPYTELPKTTSITDIQHKRYTMEEVGKIDQRIGNIEQYVALTELEKKTSQTKIFDANGLDRYKNGFVADQFKDGSLLDVGAPLRSKIDVISRELKPNASIQMIPLVEPSGINDATRNSNGYQLTGNFVSLPYTETPIVSQKVASRKEYINGFTIFRFIGTCKITPEVDSWQETSNAVLTEIVSSDIHYNTNTINNVVNSTNAIQVIQAGAMDPNHGSTVDKSKWVSIPPGWYDLGKNIIVEDTILSSSQSTISKTVVSTVSDVVNALGSIPAQKMRSIPIMCEVRGMKPFSTIYGYLDNSSIDSYITSCAKIIITAPAGKFVDFRSNIAGNEFSYSRDLETTNSTNTGFSHVNLFSNGEIISIAASGPTRTITAVVVAQETEINSTGSIQYSMYIALPRSYTSNPANYTSDVLTAGQVIKGKTSNATATVVSYNSNPGMVTNSNGSWFGFIVPANNTFDVGAHEIKFNDVAPSVLSDAVITEATGQFTSIGLINYTKELLKVKQDIYENTIIINNVNRNTLTQLKTYRPDPLAQSFRIPEVFTAGTWITSVDLFFAEKGAFDLLPVVVQIGEMVNGQPTETVLTNAISVIYPSQMNLSSNGTAPTRCKFAGPVYLSPQKEYCIKVLSNSLTYKVWISQLGEKSIQDPTNIISKQPSTGVLFKSQNNSTWVPDQLQDLMFELNYAKFDISRSGTLSLNNQSQIGSLELMEPNPFKLTNGNTAVKVTHKNHGLFVGARVTYSGSADTGTASLNNTFVVGTVTDSDHYTITLGAAANLTDNVGGAAVRVSKSIKFDSGILVTGPSLSVRPNTILTSSAKFTDDTVKDIIPTQITHERTFELSAPKYIHSDLNENVLFSNSKSLSVDINLSSLDSAMSPVIDLTQLMLFTNQNKINAPSSADIVTAIDANTIISAASCVFTQTVNTISCATADLSKFIIGSYVTITGTTSNNTAGFDCMVIDIDLLSATPVIYVSKALVNETVSSTIVQYETFIDEISPINGTAESKYQHLPIVLQSPATALKILFAACIPSTTDIDLYYRSTTVSSGVPLSETKWVLVSPNYKKTHEDEFIDLDYEVNGIHSFNTFQVKLVQRSTNTSIVPRIKDLRVIALA